MTTDGGRVLAVVLTYSAPEHVRRCVEALAAQDRRAEAILVIDNCGEPAVTAEMFDASLGVRVHRTEENLGPGGGFALAVEEFLASEYDHVWLMDDDVSPEPSCLSALLEAVDGRRDAIAIPYVDPNGDTSKRFEGWGWYGPLIPRAVVQTAGGPRADFVWWLEDTEYLGHRIPNAGVEVLRPAAVAHWATSRASRTRPAWKYFYEARNLTYLHVRTLHGRHAATLVREVRRRAVRIVRREEHRSRKLLALGHGVFDGLRGKLGLTHPLTDPHRPDQRETETADDQTHAAGWLEQAAAKANAGDLAGAAECARRAGGLLAEDDPDRRETLVQAAQLFASAGRHADAAEVWAEAAACGASDAERARDLAWQGSEARHAGRWAEAEAVGRRALELADTAMARSTRAYADIAHLLGVTYKYTGRFDEAERLYRQALDVAEAEDDEEFVATICHNLGGLAHARGAYAEGEPWARRAVDVRERSGADALVIATDRGALAALLIGLGHRDEAKELLRRCRDDLASALGTDHYEIGAVDANLATLALAEGDLEAAELHARTALRIKERSLGADHPDLAPTLTTLGTIRRRGGDVVEAIELHERALEVLRDVVDPGHPLIAKVRNNLAAAKRGTSAAGPEHN